MSNRILAVLMLFPFLFLTGCYDIKEIDETAYIVALGIDKADNGNFEYTFQFSSPLALSGGSEKESGSPGTEKSSSGENSTVSNLTIEAPDFYIARNMTNNFMSKNVDMSHLKLIIFSSVIDAENLEKHSQLLLREREVRPHTTIAVSDTKASEFLEKVNPELESNTSKYYELMSLRSNNIYAPTKRLHDFVDELTDGTRDTVLPIATSGKKIRDFPGDSSTDGWIGTYQSAISSENSVLCGMAIFKNGKLTNAMNGDSSMIYNILNNHIENCTITIADKHNPDRTVSFRIIIPEKADFDIDTNSKTVTLSQNLRAEFLGSILPEGYQTFDELYSHLRDKITTRFTAFLTEISKEKQADILSINQKLRPKFSTLKEWNDFDWNTFYSQARFSVKITLS